MTDQLSDRLRATFRWLDPGPHSTHLVSDRSGWWRDPAVLAQLGEALGGLFRAECPTVVVSPEVTGFLVGPLTAVALGIGFVEALTDSRPQRIAEPVTWRPTRPDYRGRQLRVGVRSRLLGPGDRVLVVDDWVATGAQVAALYEVITALGAAPIGTAAIIADCAADVVGTLRIRALLTGSDIG